MTSGCAPEPQAVVPEPQAVVPEPQAVVPEPQAVVLKPQAVVPEPQAVVLKPPAGCGQTKPCLWCHSSSDSCGYSSNCKSPGPACTSTHAGLYANMRSV